MSAEALQLSSKSSIGGKKLEIDLLNANVEGAKEMQMSGFEPEA